MIIWVQIRGLLIPFIWVKDLGIRNNTLFSLQYRLFACPTTNKTLIDIIHTLNGFNDQFQLETFKATDDFNKILNLIYYQ